MYMSHVTSLMSCHVVTILTALHDAVTMALNEHVNYRILHPSYMIHLHYYMLEVKSVILFNR